MTGKIIGVTGYSKGNSIEVPMRLILKDEGDEFVIRYQRKDNKMEWGGSYYRTTLEEAKEAFKKRVKVHNEDYKEGNASHLGAIVWK